MNNLLPIPSTGKKNRGALYKNKIREYLIEKLKVRDLLPGTWTADEASRHNIFRKFSIHYVMQAKKSSAPRGEWK